MNKDNTPQDTQDIKGYCPYCHTERELKHEWRNWYRCRTCFNKSQYTPQPEENNKLAEFLEAAKEMTTPDEWDAILKACQKAQPDENKTPENSGNVPRSMRAYWKQQAEQLQTKLTVAENRIKELEAELDMRKEVHERNYQRIGKRVEDVEKQNDELEARNKELERLLIEMVKEDAAKEWSRRIMLKMHIKQANGEQYIEEAVQQYKSQHPEAFEK